MVIEEKGKVYYRCALLGCKNPATHWCIDCDRPICNTVSEIHQDYCFDVHSTVEIDKFLESFKHG